MPFALALVETHRFSRSLVDHVGFEQKTLAPFVDEEAVVGRAPLGIGATVDIVDQIPTQDGPLLKSQRVKASAIREGFHHVVDVSVFGNAPDLGRGRGVPAIPDRDPGVRQVVDDIVGRTRIG